MIITTETVCELHNQCIFSGGIRSYLKVKQYEHVHIMRPSNRNGRPVS
jgi:hypothetical protein